MDFGDILDAWEGRTSKPQKKGKNREAAQGDEKRVDPVTAWMRVHGVVDKDAEAQEAEEDAGERRRRLLGQRPDAVIDLHGLTRNEAWDALEAFFQGSRCQGFEKVLVVHGKGNHSEGEAVLKKTVREFIERCPFAGESGHNSAAKGGSGVTWVVLKG